MKESALKLHLFFGYFRSAGVVFALVVGMLITASGAAFAQSEQPDPETDTTAATSATETTDSAPSAAEAGFGDQGWDDADTYFEDSGLGAIDALLEDPEWEGPRFSVDGYYRLYWNVVGNPDVEGAGNQTGPKQLDFFQHRLRVAPTIGINDKTFIHTDIVVGQGIRACEPGTSIQPFHAAPCGGIMGANGVVVLDRQASDAFTNIKMLSLWGEVTTPVGAIRAGRQPSDWGLGIFANAGNRDPIFGQAQYGDIADRIAFGTKPMGEDSDLIVALIYDRIAEGTQQLGIAGTPQIQDRGKTIHQGVLVALYKTAPLDLGLYQIMRSSNDPYNRIYGTDIYGRLDIGLLYGAFESVWLYGKSRSLPFLDQDDLSYDLGNNVRIAQWAWAAELGLRFDWYDVKLHLGNAQGDQNLTNDRPDPKITGISFHPDYNVGLIMFDYAYANLVERRIKDNFDRLGVLVNDGVLTQAQVDELEIAADLARTQGGVSNAFYLNPMAVLEPVENLTTKLGLLWAQSNAGVAVLGEGAGALYRKNLGWEFDAGIEYRFRKRFVFAVEAGVFLPGDVFDQPETRFDEVTGLDVPVFGEFHKADPVYLGRAGFTFLIK